MITMSSSRPYLIRAIRDWIQDNGLTPYVLVQATRPGTQVPEAYVENGRIVLNLSDRAIEGLTIDGEGLSFSARFGGRNQFVQVPIEAVLAIYARENGEGMVFESPGHEEGGADEPAAGSAPQEGDRPERPRKAPHLELIKG